MSIAAFNNFCTYESCINSLVIVADYIRCKMTPASITYVMHILQQDLRESLEIKK